MNVSCRLGNVDVNPSWRIALHLLLSEARFKFPVSYMPPLSHFHPTNVRGHLERSRYGPWYSYQGGACQ